MEEGNGSNPPLPPEDNQRNELTEGLAENVVVFQQYVEQVIDAVDRDQNFNELTAESYDKKKSYMKEHLDELSNLHNKLADQYADLIEEISLNRQSQIQNQHLLQSSDSSNSPQGLESPVPPVDDDALKLEDNEETLVLVKRISILEDEVESWKQKLWSLNVENAELKQEIKENAADISEYMSGNTLEIKEMEERLHESEEFAKNIVEQKRRLLAENESKHSQHDAIIVQMTNNMSQIMDEITRKKNAHEEKEKEWNGVIEQLKHQVKKKSELLEDLSNVFEDLISEKSAQHNLIHQLKTELDSVKSENARLLPPLDNVQKLAKELKLKVEELEREVDRQREAMSDGDRN